MPPPRTVRDVQRLTGRLAALNRFLSRSADRSLPFFQILLAVKNFEWTADCQKAFDLLKEHLAQLPAICVPTPGELLYLYLAASAYAVSAVLIKEDAGVQKPVYYVSRALYGPEQRYLPIEKLVLALVHAARWLRPYFQAHPICVLTDQNLKQILLKPEASGRLQKWAIELGEHDIQYKPRVSIKGQAVADFIVEMAENTQDVSTDVPIVSENPSSDSPFLPDKQWTLFVDGASSTDGSGAGLLLCDPTGVELTYALRFDFTRHE